MLVTYFVNFRLLNDHLFGKELFLRFTASAFRKLPSIYVFSYFPFGFEGRIWDLIVSVPDHCLSFYFGYPWIDARIRSFIREKEKLYHEARRSNVDSLKSRYKRLRCYSQKEIRDAYLRYVSNIFTPSETDNNLEGCNRNDRPKRFWSIMTNLRKDSSGVSCLRDNGYLETGNKDKTDIFSR